MKTLAFTLAFSIFAVQNKYFSVFFFSAHCYIHCDSVSLMLHTHRWHNTSLVIKESITCTTCIPIAVTCTNHSMMKEKFLSFEVYISYEQKENESNGLKRGELMSMKAVVTNSKVHIFCYI